MRLVPAALAIAIALFACRAASACGAIQGDDIVDISGGEDFYHVIVISQAAPKLSDPAMAQIKALIELRERLQAAHFSGLVASINGADISESLRIEADAILDIDRRLKLLENPGSWAQ